MTLAQHVNTFGQYMLKRHGQRVHKIALDAGLTCPNRDGSQGVGGCTFCNNSSFNQVQGTRIPVTRQLHNGQQVISRRTGARLYLAYFQTYTNTYADVDRLQDLYDRALQSDNIIGLSIGTRPDCVNDRVLDLLSRYRDAGYDVWLELGLQSAHDRTLRAVNRGHDFDAYRHTLTAARQRELPVCTHLILGLPGENLAMNMQTLERVLALGVDGLKLHPLHVVKGTQLARQWKRGDYRPLTMAEYIEHAVQLIEHTPASVIFHRVTATAPRHLLLAPDWCALKWDVINGIENALVARAGYQGKHAQGSPLNTLQECMS